MSDRWFYAVGEERRGPVEKDELLKMIADGRVSRTTLVWTRSLRDWTAAGDLAELKDAPWPARGEDTVPTLPRKKTAAAGPIRASAPSSRPMIELRFRKSRTPKPEA